MYEENNNNPPNSPLNKQNSGLYGKSLSGLNKPDPGTSLSKPNPGTVLNKPNPGTVLNKPNPGTVLNKPNPGTVLNKPKNDEFKIPNTLFINVKTLLADHHKFLFQPNMSIKSTNFQFVYINPLVKYDKNKIMETTESNIFSQFFNPIEFNKMIDRHNQQPVSYQQAFDANYISHNIKLTIDTLFNSKKPIIYLDNQPYTIVTLENHSSNWQIDTKPLEVLKKQFPKEKSENLLKQASEEKKKIPIITKQSNAASTKLSDNQELQNKCSLFVESKNPRALSGLNDKTLTKIFFYYINFLQKQFQNEVNRSYKIDNSNQWIIYNIGVKKEYLTILEESLLSCVACALNMQLIYLQQSTKNPFAENDENGNTAFSVKSLLRLIFLAHKKENANTNSIVDYIRYLQTYLKIKFVIFDMRKMTETTLFVVDSDKTKPDYYLLLTFLRNKEAGDFFTLVIQEKGGFLKKSLPNYLEYMIQSYYNESDVNNLTSKGYFNIHTFQKIPKPIDVSLNVVSDESLKSLSSKPNALSDPMNLSTSLPTPRGALSDASLNIVLKGGANNNYIVLQNNDLQKFLQNKPLQQKQLYVPTKVDQYSKLAFYTEVELDLYPGENVSENQKKWVKCNNRYEKMRQSWSNIFGNKYRPSVMKKENLTKKNGVFKTNFNKTRKFPSK